MSSSKEAFNQMILQEITKLKDINRLESSIQDDFNKRLVQEIAKLKQELHFNQEIIEEINKLKGMKQKVKQMVGGKKHSKSKKKDEKSSFRTRSINSTIEPIVKIAKSKSHIKRIFWTICFLITGFLSFLFITTKFVSLFEYPITTKFRYFQERSVDFPTIAFCNSNPFTTEFALDYIIDIIETLSHNNTRVQLNESKKEFLIKNFDSFEYSIDYTITTFANESTRKKLGLGIDEILINCRFAGEYCNTSHFQWFYSYQMGNCFEFVPPVKVFNSGQKGELHLDLFASQDRDHFETNPAIGFQFMIFNKSENRRFNSYFEKYLVMTNAETDISFQRTFVNKLPKPYSDCTIDLRTATIDSIDSKIYKYFYENNFAYKQFYCFRFAYILETLKHCGCVYEYGIVKEGEAHICNTTEEINCDTYQYKNHFLERRFDGRYDKECPLECNRDEFDITISAQSFAKDTDIRLLVWDNSPFNYSKFNETDHLKESIVRVNLYYKDIGYDQLDEIAFFTFIDFFSETGGLLGLFLGMNLLSVIELLDLAVEMMYYVWHKRHNRASN